MIWAPWRTVSVTPSSPGGVNVYLEPGEAVALNAGYLASRVLDVVENGGSGSPFGRQRRLPHARRAGNALPAAGIRGQYGKQGGPRYRLAGPTCLAGDVIGDYDFDSALCRRGTWSCSATWRFIPPVKTIPSTACLSPISGSWTAPGVWSS